MHGRLGQQSRVKLRETGALSAGKGLSPRRAVMSATAKIDSGTNPRATGGDDGRSGMHINVKLGSDVENS